MTTHATPSDISTEHPQLPNQHFSSWLRSQTTLFISQIAAVLAFVLFIAEEVYYLSYAGKAGTKVAPLAVGLIIDIAHIAFMTVFIMVLIGFLDDNERGSHRIGLVYKRVFKKPQAGEEDWESSLSASKKQLRKFKVLFLWFWIGMLLLYVCFACEHGYKLATKKSPESNEANLLISAELKDTTGSNTP